MASVIVGIHGLGNKSPKRLERRWWKAAIKEGLDKNCRIRAPRFEYIMVYWADLLYRHRLHRREDFDFDRLYNREPYLPAAPGALRRYKDSWLDDLRATGRELVGDAIDTLKHHLGLDRLGEELLARVFRDLDFYYDVKQQIRDRTGQPRQARQVLMDELKDTLMPLRGQRIMLIAHSMGSIIAYDVLRNIGRRDPAFEVAHFVTIGSPLGWPDVKEKVHEERKSYSREPLRTPTVVTERWVNYADRRDPVTLDIHLRDDYGPNKRGVQVEDDIVLNDYVSPKGERNHHKSYGYLRTPELSEHIRDFLK